MTVVTYTGNVSPGNTGNQVFLRGGALRLRVGEYADLTQPEIDLLSQRIVLTPGSSGAVAATNFSPNASSSDLSTLQATLEGELASQESGDVAALAAAAVPTIVSPGNLGASRSQALTTRLTWIVGTLNANHALTLTGAAAGYVVRLLLTQDGTGGRTLSVNGTAVPVNSAASTTTVVELPYDGTDFYVRGI